jgi:hypothetical protein
VMGPVGRRRHRRRRLSVLRPRFVR